MHISFLFYLFFSLFVLASSPLLYVPRYDRFLAISCSQIFFSFFSFRVSPCFSRVNQTTSPLSASLLLAKYSPPYSSAVVNGNSFWVSDELVRARCVCPSPVFRRRPTCDHDVHHPSAASHCTSSSARPAIA